MSEPRTIEQIARDYVYVSGELAKYRVLRSDVNHTACPRRGNPHSTKHCMCRFCCWWRLHSEAEEMVHRLFVELRDACAETTEAEDG